MAKYRLTVRPSRLPNEGDFEFEVIYERIGFAKEHKVATGYGTSPQSRVKPFAFHNPIFVDVDGGGFTPNGDLLDWPLPVSVVPATEKVNV